MKAYLRKPLSKDQKVLLRCLKKVGGQVSIDTWKNMYYYILGNTSYHAVEGC